MIDFYRCKSIVRSATESSLLCRLRYTFQALKELDQSKLLLLFYAQVSLLFVLIIS